jgi:parallel beta-helix repeat protein
MLIRYFLILISMFIFLVACSAEPIIPPTSTASATPALTATATLIPSPTTTPTPGPTMAHILSDGSGDYATLEIAIESVVAESTLILGEGTFHLEGSLDINKPLTLIGSGRDETIVEGEGPVAVIRYTGEGRLTIRDVAFSREGNLAAAVIVILSGEVNFNNCRFSNGASNEDGSISGNGLIFFGDTTGVVENCEIDSNGRHGVSILDEAQPRLVGNEIHSNGGYGIIILNEAQPKLVGNEIHNNGSSGVLVGGHAKPEVTENHIHDNKESGIQFKLEEDGGLVVDNVLEANSVRGFLNGTDILVWDAFSPTIVSNKCSYEQRRSGDVFDGDLRGIVFLMGFSTYRDLDMSAAASKVEKNDCALVWCSQPTFVNPSECRSR